MVIPPKSLSWEILDIAEQSKEELSSWLVVPTIKTWHLYSLKGICQTVDQSPIATRSLCRDLAYFRSAECINNQISIVSKLRHLPGEAEVQVIDMDYKRGVGKTDPWESPLLTSVQSEGKPLTMTLWLLPARHFSIQEATLPWMPRARTFLMSLLWGTLSKDLRKSKKLHPRPLEWSHSLDT